MPALSDRVMKNSAHGGWSIRTRLVVLVIAICVLFVALYVYSARQAAEDASQDVQQQSMQLALLLAGNLDRFLAEKRQLLETLARRPLMRIEQPPECDHLFTELTVLFPALDNFGMTNRAGRVVCSALPLGTRPVSVANMPFFKKLMATGLFTISEPFLSPLSHKWIMSLMQPRRDDQGRLIGALGMPIDLVRFEQVLGAVQLPEGGVVTLINANGRVLARTLAPTDWVARDVAKHDFIQRVLAQDRGKLRASDIDGRERYIGFAHIASVGWRVYVGVPADLVKARAEALQRRALELGGVLLLMVLAMGVFVGQGIARPIRVLADTVRRIAAGAGQQRAALSGPREISAVAAEFNALLDRRLIMEEELLRQHVRAQQYLDIAGVMFAVLDVEGRIAMINRKGCAVLGYTEQELLGKNWFTQCLPAGLQAEIQDVFRELMAGRIEQVEYYENQVLTRAGEMRYLGFHNTVLQAPDGRIEGVLFSAEDITDRRRTEKALKEAYAELERRVAERTAMLDLANQELEAFSYSVSHDLRAPLRAIEGFSQALLEDYNDRLDSTGQDYLERVCRSCRRMNALIDDLLSLSRATSAELHRRDCDLGVLGAELIAELRAADPGREVIFNADAGLRVQADTELLRIALGNLLSNAWKFTRDSAAARIELGVTEEQGRAVYYVRDNGVGFDMQYARQLFEPFQRLHDQDVFEGTGVGLATVRRIIRRHGGTVWAQGQPGAGATFYFTLGA